MSSPRHFSKVAGVSAMAVAAALVLSTGTAYADNPLQPKSAFTMVVDPGTGLTNTPTDGESVPNVDSVKSTIRAYYNASGGAADKNSSRYITQVRGIENQLLKALPANHATNAAVVFDIDDTLLWNYDYEDGGSNFNYDPTTNAAAVNAGFPAVPGMPAVLRTLYNRGYKLYGITGRPGLNASPSNQEPVTLTNLANVGFTVDGTAGGTPLFTANTLYTKDQVVTTGGVATIPTQTWVNCNNDAPTTTLPANAANCSTVEYKASTRAHIASTDGVDIVMNVGDQWSDLQGGNEDDWTKIPNPTYYLASADINGAPASDALMVPPSSYVMQPDGSSGYSVTSGDDIPNIDPVRKMIRAYYAADSTGVANKSASPYISQLASLESTWTAQVKANCSTESAAYSSALAAKTAAQAAVTTAAAKLKKDVRKAKKAKKAVAKAKNKAARKHAHQKLRKAVKKLKRDAKALAAAEATLAGKTVPAQPAVVFDADDTTLWNYDLEDNVLKFVYNATTAAGYISAQAFPAVPGMVPVVQAAKASGCAIFGLTGRPTSQQADTVANLAKVGFVDGAGQPLFTNAQFYTKGPVTVANNNATIPTQPWVDCGADNACSTIEYKSATRGHIESLGYDVVGNFGDQYSDLIGGYAKHVYKLPNPTYYLP